MDTTDIMQHRQQIEIVGNKHWRKAGQDQTSHPDFASLIPITDAQFPVDARKLHAVLESNQQFSDWITGRIRKYGFQINSDFSRFHNSMNATEYKLTIDTAKEMAMVERNYRGKQVRQYFIECERRLIEQTPRLPRNYEEALEDLLAMERERKRLEAENLAMQPKADFHDAVAATTNIFSMNEAAKQLGMGQNRLFHWLRANKVLLEGGPQHNQPYQRYIDAGYFRLRTGVHEVKGDLRQHVTTMVTGKGLTWLHGKLHACDSQSLIGA